MPAKTDVILSTLAAIAVLGIYGAVIVMAGVGAWAESSPEQRTSLQTQFLLQLAVYLCCEFAELLARIFASAGARSIDHALSVGLDYKQLLTV